MRILIIHQNFIDHQHPGGTRHLDLAKQLVRNGHEVTIVASTVDYLTGHRIRESDEAEASHEGVRVLRAYALPSVQRSLMMRVASYISFVPFALWTGLRSGPTDLVFGTTPPIFQLPVPWIVSVLKRVPFILEVRDLWPDFAIGMGLLKNRILIALARFIERFFYRRANHIIVNSPAYVAAMTRSDVDKQKVSLLANAVDLELFQPESRGEPVRQQFGLSDKFVVTYAGALGMANDIDTMLRVAANLRDEQDVHFLIAGAGNQKSRLQQAATDQRLENVCFGGLFAKTEIGQVLAASDACFATLLDIPEFRTPFPNKVFDYMAAARPIVLAIDGAARELVERAGSGIVVPPADDQAIAAAILKLRDDRQLAQRMGQAGRAYVEREHTLEGQARKLEAIFRQLFSGR